MLTYNDQTKARFPLSLGGRGATALLLLPLAALFAPQAALAQCAPPTGTEAVPAPASGTVTCQPGDYADGIYYDSIGDLTLEVPDDTADLTVNADGVSVTGNLADSVFWDSSAFVSGDIVGTGGAVLDYSSGSGAIGIEAGGDIRANGAATHAIQAVSGSGNVTIQTNEGGRIFGGDYGIQAETGGAGTLTISVADDINIDSTTGVAAIDATTGTGPLTIDIVSKSSADTGSDGIRGGLDGNAIRTDAGGDALINIGEGRRVHGSGSGTSSETLLNLLAAGETVVNNDGAISPGTANHVAIQAAGGTLTLSNNGSIRGAMDYTALTGGYVFNNNSGGLWDVSRNAASELGAGEINNAGTILFQRGGYVSALGATFTGTGDSVLEMRTMILDGSSGQSDCTSPTVASCLDLSGGATAGQTAILIVPQKLDGDDPFAKAIDKPLNPGVVLVDVSGGSSQAGHFVLHPDSHARIDRDSGPSTDIEEVAIYEEDPIYGAVLDTGDLFDYALLYNPDTQQHLLASVPQKEGVEYVSVIQQALSVWHTTSDAVAGRQADLRDGAVGGGWFRLVGEQAEHNTAPTLTTHGNDFTYDQTYSLRTGAGIGGFDLIGTEDYVLGVHGGIVSGRTNYRDSSTRGEHKGATVGVYGGWWRGGLTLDGTVNVNMLELEHLVSDELEDSSSNVVSLGARVEAGFQAPLLGDALYLQPLVTMAYVSADVEDLDLRAYDAAFEGSESMRSALGMRVGGKAAMQSGGSLGYWLTARRWEEHESDARLIYDVQGGDDLVIRDDLSGTFEEIGLGVSISDSEDILSAYLSASGKFADDLDDSYNISIGIRKRW